jgi:hypothetical protein
VGVLYGPFAWVVKYGVDIGQNTVGKCTQYPTTMRSLQNTQVASLDLLKYSFYL